MKLHLWAKLIVIAAMPKLAIAQQVITHTQVFDLGDGPAHSQPDFLYVTFPGFDPELGELESVTWQLDATFAGEAVYTGTGPAGCRTGYAANMLLQAWNPGGEYLETGLLPVQHLSSPEDGGVQAWQGFHTDTVTVPASPVFEGGGVSFFVAQTGQTHFWPAGGGCAIDAEATRSGWDVILTLTYTYAPASCAHCGDVDGSGVVDVLDFVSVIGALGECGGCPEDVNCDGTVDLADLVEMLAQWQSGGVC